MKNNKTFKEFVFLLDKNNNWIEKRLIKFITKLPKKYRYSVTKKTRHLKNKIIFVLSYTKILKENFLKKNKEVLIVHPSNLPKDRGFSPVQNQILRKKNKIFVKMIRAAKEVDKGPICIQNTFYLKGHEIYEEIRDKQSAAMFKIIEKYLNKYPNIKFVNQKGKSTFNKRRKFNDNELNINKNIKSQFNLLRIVNNESYPAHFKYKGHTYILKISKKK